MDPISIVASAAAVSKVIWSCSTALGTFIQNVSNADQAIQALYSETESLRRTLASIINALETPSLRKHEKLPLWEDVNDCLVECNKALETFSQKLETIGIAHPEKANVFRSAVHVFKMNFRDDEIRILRAQLHSHSSAVSMVLHMITVRISSTAPDVVLETLTPQLRTLVNLVVELHKSALPPDASNRGLQRSRTKLERSAKVLASKASAVVSSRSTIWSGSQAEQPTLVMRATKQSVTTGSEFGEPLSAETMHRISQWMTRDSQDDDTTLSIQEETLSLFSKPDGSADSRTTPENAAHNEAAGKEEVISEDDDEIEFELEIARRYAVEGRKSAQSDPIQAENVLRKAVAKFKAIKSPQAAFEVPQIMLEIARLCFEQDNMAVAAEICALFLADTPADDQSRRILLEASYLLPQVYLRRGNFTEVIAQCKRTLKGRRRFKGKDTAYFQAVALISSIHRHKGEELEALAYDGLLPLDFPKPEFKPPVPYKSGMGTS